LNPENRFVRFFKLFADFETGKNHEIIADAINSCKESSEHTASIYPLLVLINVRAKNLQEAQKTTRKSLVKTHWTAI
jgi:hypothetical protein